MLENSAGSLSYCLLTTLSLWESLVQVEREC